MASLRAPTLTKPPDYGVQAILAARARFHLSYRLTVRLWQFASPDGGAQTVPWRLAVVAFAALDIGIWVCLRNSERFGLGTRLAIDSVDIAVWSLAPYPHGVAFNSAVFIGFPLAVEAGFRRRMRGLVVPAVTLAATAGVRSVARQQPSAYPFLWLVLGVGCGLLLRRYIDRQQRRGEQEAAQRRSAEYRRAFLAGQNSVAMGASSAVDAIEGVLPVLGQPEPGSVLFELTNAWKSSLRQHTEAHAAYLGQVLSEWAADYNDHPDLSSRVELRPTEGIGTTLLTGVQEVGLCRLLSAAGLRGVLPVRLENPDTPQRPPGGAFGIIVGPHVVRVPADPSHAPRPYDPGPAAFAIATLIMLADVVGFPLAPKAAVGITLSLLGGWWAHERLQRLGRAARPMILGTALAVALIYTAVATLSLLRPLTRGGLEQYPVGAGLGLLALLGGMYWDDLGPPARWLTVGGATLVVVVSWVLHPLGHHADHLLLQSAWAVPLLVTALGLANRLDAASALYVTESAENDRTTVALAFGGGRDSVVALVRAARDEAHERLAVLRATLSPQLEANVRQRLEEVDRRLDKLVRAGEPWSWTTTS